MNLDAALLLLAESPASPLDLAELALQLAREEYPALDIEAYLAELDAMAHEARPYLRGPLPSRVQGLCRYLFHEMGFRGNQPEYYDPRNSYFNEVLDRRTGIPITLSLLAMAVGNRAGLHVVGVGLPGHFVAKALDEEGEVLFDPFHGGRQLSLVQCEHLVQQVTGQALPITPTILQPLAQRPFVQRLLSNLKANYLRQGDHARAIRVIERLRQLDPADVLHRRDLGISLYHSGEPGRAIDHLHHFLEVAPTNGENEAVRQLLRKARGEVARWN